MNENTESVEMVAPFPNVTNFINLTGRRYGRLTVISYAGEAWWNCLCDCGTSKKVRANHLRTGHTTSCGCSQIGREPTHGMSKSPEYYVWVEMKARCYNPNNADFRDYGGRNISVCQRWRDSFANFFSDMGPRTSKKHSINRIDNDGNYCKENCCWGTMREQARNRRNSIMVEFEGRLINLAELSERTGIYYGTLNHRFHRGWTVEQMISGR